MRKKQLLTLLHQSVEKNGALELRLKELETVVSELKRANEELTEKTANAENLVESLKQELEQKNAEPEQPAPENTVFQEQAEQSAGGDLDNEQDYFEEPKPAKRAPVITEDGSIDVAALESIPINKEMKYASEAIGEIIVKCASACNEFAKVGGPEAREFINLALGRTEVFKADCLTIASSNTAFSVKKECIDRIRHDTEDYFKGLCESIKK